MSAPEDIRLSSPEDIRESVRRRYAEAANRAASADPDHGPAVATSCCGGAKASTSEQGPAVATSCCGGAPVATTDEQGREVFGAELYGSEAGQGAPDAAVAALAYRWRTLSRMSCAELRRMSSGELMCSFSFWCE